LVYSALIGQMTQSVVIGLPCTARVGNEISKYLNFSYSAALDTKHTNILNAFNLTLLSNVFAADL